MHEATFLRALLRRIDEIAATEHATRVTAVTVRLGALSQMSPEHFREHWVDAAAGSIAQDAVLTTEQSSDPTDPRALDVTLVSIDVEDPEPAA